MALSGEDNTLSEDVVAVREETVEGESLRFVPAANLLWVQYTGDHDR